MKMCIGMSSNNAITDQENCDIYLRKTGSVFIFLTSGFLVLHISHFLLTASWLIAFRNPFMSSGLFFHNALDRSISSSRGFC